MKNKMCLMGVLIFLILLPAALAAGVSGKWVGKAANAEITLNLKVEGTKLTGTINNSLAAGDTPINDGKVNGDDISFYVVRTINDNEVKVWWKGKATGDEIKFVREIEGQAGSATDIIIKRSK